MSKTEERPGSFIGVRVPTSLKTLLRRYVELDTHINESDFIRDAIREKILRDAPGLYRELFQQDAIEVEAIGD